MALVAALACDDGGGKGGDAGFDPPEWCPPPESGRQEVEGTPASPYFVDHPDAFDVDAPTVVFLPGGDGGRSHADGTWAGFIEGATRGDDFRVVMPYSDSSELPVEQDRLLEILDEVLMCYGGDPGRVHLAGHSAGGYMAFDLMLDSPHRFATLAGAPGQFTVFSSEGVTTALSGKSVLVGAGEYDLDWKDAMLELDEQLTLLGIDSRYIEFEGQNHTPSPMWTGRDDLFDFWAAH